MDRPSTRKRTTRDRLICRRKHNIIHSNMERRQTTSTSILLLTIFITQTVHGLQIGDLVGLNNGMTNFGGGAVESGGSGSNSNQACPPEIHQLCSCVDELDGVLLNCTASMSGAASTDAIQLIETLRSVQSQLGLLKSLTIRNAKLALLPNNFFAGLYIKRLALIDCAIRVVEPNAFNGLESMLQELRISDNALVEMPTKALSGMNALLKLDLSNNTIGELKAEHALPRMAKLFDIDLSHNRIDNIHKSFFENAKNSLQTINLGHNNIVEVPASALRGFRQLKALHLHSNQIRSLAALSFMNLPVLSLLNLASNRIHTIHKQAFLNAPNLRFLYLTDNQLNRIQPHQFASFEQLEMIDLSNNGITVLDNDTFSNLVALKQLYLAENQISQIEPFAFDNSSIVVLIMESNQLHECQKDMFRGLTKLQQLSLKNNRITNVDPNAFQTNAALVMVDLSHNEILDLAPATFLSQLNMLLVDLSYNKLPRTPYSAFNRRIVTVLLQENPLVCMEKLHMLQQGVGVFVPTSEDLVCGGKKSQIQHLVEGKEENLPLPTANSTKPAEEKIISEGNTQTSDEDSPFKQALVSADGQSPIPTQHPQFENFEGGQSPDKISGQSLTVHHLSNIRPLTRKISTAQINQFVDQSQFSRTQSPQNPLQHQPTKTTPLQRPIFPPLTFDESGIPSFVENHQNVHDASDFNNDNTPIEHQYSASPPPSNELNTSTALTTDVHEQTTETSPRTMTTVDIANDPNVIYPLPVPFLTRPPKMHMSHNVVANGGDALPSPNNIVITQTLPPSIVIAPPNSNQNRPLLNGKESSEDNNGFLSSSLDSMFFESSTHSSSSDSHKTHSKIEQFELNENIVNDNHDNGHRNGASFDDFSPSYESSYTNGANNHHPTGQRNLPTAVIAGCLGTVALVMCAVFVGMCVAKRRQIRLIGGGSSGDSMTGANEAMHNGMLRHHQMAAAHAAQMNVVYGGSVGGTLPRGSNGTLNARLPPLQDDIYGWMYSPYNVYANK